MSSAPTTLRLSAAAPTEKSAAAQPRLPGLDWLRASAALAVVALHAGIPYMTHHLPSLEWCVRSTERSPLVDALCWAINIAVMPTFFLMGGALAAGIWKRQPGLDFLAHRSRRLLLPLAFAILIVLPADMYVWLIGWYTQGLIPWKKVLSIKLPFPLNEQFWGVAHLWYLE
ncbi:MAG TPA: acyltransferase family protein, partial [Caulifigura sp.]|nr:acyltransferase family protein [Caulifigura sp.]